MIKDKFNSFENNCFQEIFPFKDEDEHTFNNNSFEIFSPISIWEESEFVFPNNFVLNSYVEKPENIIKDNTYNNASSINIDLKEKENPKLSGKKNEKKLELPKSTKKELKEEQEKQDNMRNSTKNSSDKKEEFKIEKLLFTSEKFISYGCPKKENNKNFPSYFRMDMAKKYYKTKISQFGTDKLNKYIKESDLPFKLKKNIHLPNSKLFTSKVTEIINYNSLNLSLREMFTIGKENNTLQKQNFINFSKIDGYIQNLEEEQLSERIINIKNFLDMTYEDLIRMFYDSEEFLEFKNEELNKFFDKGVLSQEGFLLSESYGLIKLFKMIKKRKTENNTN